MKKTVYFKSDLVCLECGNVFSIMRAVYDLKKYGHIKDLWCYRCKYVTKHFEVIDSGKFLFEAQNTIKDDPKNVKIKKTDSLETIAKKRILNRKKVNGQMTDGS